MIELLVLIVSIWCLIMAYKLRKSDQQHEVKNELIYEMAKELHDLGSPNVKIIQDKSNSSIDT